MEALDKIFDYKLNSSMDDYILETLEEYKLYLKLLEQLDPKVRSAFLWTIKHNEIINNHDQKVEVLQMFQEVNE